MILTAVIFILVLGIFIFVHEFGHFIMAKRAGVRVEEFGFGLPPRIFGVKKGETVYSVNWLPIGGFVKIYGEDGENKSNSHSFASKSIWQRAKIISAGVFLNYIFAALVFSLVFFIGVPTIAGGENDNLKNEAIRIILMQNDSPAQKAGLQLGDELIAARTVNGALSSEIHSVDDADFFLNNAGKTVVVSVRRGASLKDFEINLRDSSSKQGQLGVTLAKTGIKSYPWYQSLWKGVLYTIDLTGQMIFAFAGLIKTFLVGSSPEVSFGGPVFIYQLTDQMSKLGINYLLNFVAFLSLNLAIINFLPLPALDGGRLVFLLIEKIKGSPVKQVIERRVNAAGFALLILLMAFITYKDIVRLF